MSTVAVSAGCRGVTANTGTFFWGSRTSFRPRGGRGGTGSTGPLPGVCLRLRRVAVPAWVSAKVPPSVAEDRADQRGVDGQPGAVPKWQVIDGHPGSARRGSSRRRYGRRSSRSRKLDGTVTSSEVEKAVRARAECGPGCESSNAQDTGDRYHFVSQATTLPVPSACVVLRFVARESTSCGWRRCTKAAV